MLRDAMSLIIQILFNPYKTNINLFYFEKGLGIIISDITLSLRIIIIVVSNEMDVLCLHID